MDHSEVAMHIEYDAIYNFYVQLKRKGVRLRAITEVTPSNIHYVKKLMEYIEVRHLPGVKSNFGIADRKECLLHSVSHENQPLSHAIITNAKALVDAQCFLFDTLWNNAIPAQEKIREIEEDIKPSFIETFRDPHEIRELVFDLVNSAKQEILMLLFSPTTAAGNELREEEEHAHIITQLLSAARLHGIRVRILTSKYIQEQLEKLIATERRQQEEKEEGGRRSVVERGKQGKLEIHLIETLSQQQQKHLQSNVSIMIVDSKVSLVEELKAYNKDNYNSNEALSLASYSNSDSTVLTYISIFETLWTQTELKIKM